jgi:hypothetical protein
MAAADPLDIDEDWAELSKGMKTPARIPHQQLTIANSCSLSTRPVTRFLKAIFKV